MVVYTIREAATQLKIHPKTVEIYCRRGRITAVKIGRVWRIPEEALQRFIHRVSRATHVDGKIQGWPALAAIKLAEVWNHPEEVEYPL